MKNKRKVLCIAMLVGDMFDVPVNGRHPVPFYVGQSSVSCSPPIPEAQVMVVLKGEDLGVSSTREGTALLPHLDDPPLRHG